MDVYTIFTTTPNAVVKPIHPTRMPVMLGSIDEFDTWLEGTPDEGWQLARPYPVSDMHIVNTGEKKDAALPQRRFRLGDHSLAPLAPLP